MLYVSVHTDRGGGAGEDEDLDGGERRLPRGTERYATHLLSLD